MKRLALIALALLASALGASAQTSNNPVPPINTAGAYNSSQPTCTSGLPCWFQTDVNGNLKVTASGTPSGTQDINIKQVQGAVPSLTNPLWVFPATGATFPVSGTLAITEPATTNVASSALAANQIILASAGSLYSLNVSADSTLSAAAWWIMIYNATSAPVDGTVTPARCIAMASGSTSYTGAWPVGLPFATGITVGVSTTGCFTKTASTHAFIAGDYK